MCKNEEGDSTLAKGFVCELVLTQMEGIVESSKAISFFDQVDFDKSFCYLGDRLRGEAEVIARTIIKWIKFRECQVTL